MQPYFINEALHTVPRAVGPELFFGIVGPIGTDLETLCDLLSESLRTVDYECATIRLISLVREFAPWKDLPSHPVAEYYHRSMDAGDEFRARVGDGAALALLAMQYVRDGLRAKSGSPAEPMERHAFIFRSLKHPDEVEALRQTYGSAFFLIGAYSPRLTRAENLARKIAGAEVLEPLSEHRHQAEILIQRDENESGVPFGQRVRETFPLADIFIDTSRPRNEIRRALDRFVELIFGYPFHTPTREEYGMFHAYASALRSSAMGRQVGAALCNREGDIVAVGTNEVPKAFGGQYWGDEGEDRRDFQLGIDSNDEIKRQNLSEILGRLKNAGWFAPEVAAVGLDGLLTKASAVLKGARVMSPIEYGRAVHAEMSAIMDAARRGVSVQGTSLYTTTFPCHECARHIICAGIERVYYIEPYPKSMALDLHRDAVALEDEGNGKKVVFLPFVGVAPRRYLDLFAMKERKRDDTGRPVRWRAQTALPELSGPFQSYFEAEDWMGSELKAKMASAQLTLS